MNSLVQHLKHDNIGQLLIDFHLCVAWQALV